MYSSRSSPASFFERNLSVLVEDIEFELKGHEPVQWSDFLLNPRRLRGSDFLMRWSQGVWSELRFIQAINATNTYYALPYGPSGTAPDNDVREYELYFERLEHAGPGQLKRPDLLIFRKEEQIIVDTIVQGLGGTKELPFVPEDTGVMRKILSKAVIAVECENSLWRADKMPDFGSELKPQKRLSGLPGLKKNAVLPTVILKKEDCGPLLRWQEENAVPIHIWHAFFDQAFGISFDKTRGLVDSGKIEPTVQVFQAPGGATSQKIIYKFYYHYAYPLGKVIEEPTLTADFIMDKNGHILPYVKFEGGKMSISREALDVLDQASAKSEGDRRCKK